MFFFDIKRIIHNFADGKSVEQNAGIAHQNEQGGNRSQTTASV